MSVSDDIYYKFVVGQNFVVELSTTKWIYYNFVVVLQFCSTVLVYYEIVVHQNLPQNLLIRLDHERVL